MLVPATNRYDHEPAAATRLSIELLTNGGWQRHPASIADLTRRELWIELDERLDRPLDPGRSVRLVLDHVSRPTQIAETVVLWHIGRTGNLVVVKRPCLWDPPSRREHGRIKLAVPVYIRADEESDPVPATSIDIGAGGVFCAVAMDLRIGQRVDVAVQFAPGRTFECQAEVARLDEAPDDQVGIQLVVGLHFLNLNRRDRATLVEAIVAVARDVDGDHVPRLWREATASSVATIETDPGALAIDAFEADVMPVEPESFGGELVGEQTA